VRSIEICAGAGGQALGLEQAGFEHAALVEIDPDACATLRLNRPGWHVVETDVRTFSAAKYKGIDLLAGGVPCPPFSAAGKQLGCDDERDLFPEALRLVQECSPKAVMLENVRGLFNPKFDWYRNEIINQLEMWGYACFWDIVKANSYGVSQLRPRSILIALKSEYAKHFNWPTGDAAPPPTVGQVLLVEMSSNGWSCATEWARLANGIAPTLVGGSKKHGGPDLGSTRARLAWDKLGVDGKGIADEPPSQNFIGKPKLTVKMAALIQGFPSEWALSGKKTAAYKQVGNAFPPPVAKAMGCAVINALKAESIAAAQIKRTFAQQSLFSEERLAKAMAGV
jgi:DNA (cytosine-5)-methyltransferase 1